MSARQEIELIIVEAGEGDSWWQRVEPSQRKRIHDALKDAGWLRTSRERDAKLREFQSVEGTQQ